MSTSEILSRNLQRALDVRDLSCLALAELAGLPQSAVGKICRGEVKNPGIRSVAQIAAALRVPLDWLVADKGPNGLPRGRRKA